MCGCGMDGRSGVVGGEDIVDAVATGTGQINRVKVAARGIGQSCVSCQTICWGDDLVCTMMCSHS